MKHIKRKIALLAVIAIVLTLLAQATVAYVSHVGKATNVVTSGNITMNVIETFPIGGVVVLPGDVVDKKVFVENTCEHPFYVRAKLEYAVDDTTLTAAGCFEPNINTGAWEYYDGWYYYKGIVTPNETTPLLMDKVEIVGSEVDNDYIGKKLTLTVKVQAVQSEYNPLTDGHTYTAHGWPAP